MTKFTSLHSQWTFSVMAVLKIIVTRSCLPSEQQNSLWIWNAVLVMFLQSCNKASECASAVLQPNCRPHISAKKNPCSMAVLHLIPFPSQINSDVHAWWSFLVPSRSRWQCWTTCDRKLSLLLNFIIYETHLFFKMSHSAYFLYITVSNRIVPFPGKTRPELS